MRCLRSKRVRWLSAAAVLALIATVAVITVGSASASSGCRTTSTGTTDSSGNSLNTSVTWCWNGSVVTSISPTGGSTHYHVGSCGLLQSCSFGGYDMDSYCCVGQYTWHLNRIAAIDIYTSSGGGEYDAACLRNELYLHGDGSYSTNPGNWYLYGGNSRSFPECA